MRLVWVTLAFIVATVARAAGPPVEASATQIRSALDEMHRAAGVLDVDRFMGWYLHSPSLTITFDGQIMRGWEAIRDQQRKWWSSSASKPTYTEDMPPETMLLSPEAATTLQSMKITEKADNAGVKNAHVVVTSVWKKTPEGWRIVIAHESLTQ